MTQFVANALWGLRYGAILALAFAIGIGIAFLVQGPTAFAAYHPSIPEILAGAIGTWLVGGLVVGAARPLARSSIGYLVIWIVGGVFVAGAAVIMVVGFSYFSLGATLLAGVALGFRGWAFLGKSSPSAV